MGGGRGDFAYFLCVCAFLQMWGFVHMFTVFCCFWLFVAVFYCFLQYFAVCCCVLQFFADLCVFFALECTFLLHCNLHLFAMQSGGHLHCNLHLFAVQDGVLFCTCLHIFADFCRCLPIFVYFCIFLHFAASQFAFVCIAIGGAFALKFALVCGAGCGIVLQIFGYFCLFLHIFADCNLLFCA